MVTLKKTSLLLCFLSCCLNHAQQLNPESLKLLDSIINIKAYDEAEQALNQSIQDFKAKKSYYLLTDYIYYTGKINLQLQNQPKATASVNQFKAF